MHAYASYAQIPLQDVSVTVTAIDGTAIALRLGFRQRGAGRSSGAAGKSRPVLLYSAGNVRGITQCGRSGGYLPV